MRFVTPPAPIPTPPAGFTVADAGEADLARATDVINAFEIAVEGEAETTGAELRANWAQNERYRGRWLVEDGAGTAVAHAILKTESDVYMADGYVHPDHWNRGLGGYLLDLTEATAAAAAEFDTIRTGISLHDELAHRLVLAHGYTEVRRFWSMLVRMSAQPPRREPPAGIAIEPVPATRLREFHTVMETSFAEHWGWRAETFDEWSERKSNGPATDRSLWFWALRDGEPVASVEGSVKPTHGWINQLSVLPTHRGEGLGEVLLTHALGQFWVRDVREVGLGVDAENATGATRLYEKVGFGVEHTYGIFDKPLR